MLSFIEMYNSMKSLHHHDFVEPHVALNLPKSLVDPVSINTSSSDVEVLYLFATIDSSDPPKSSKDASVFHHTTNSLPIWA
jgi:hypothetical protein